jgi:hypothetical protein
MYNYFINENAIGDGTGIDWYNAYTTLSGAVSSIEGISEASGVNLYLGMGNYYMDISRAQSSFNMYGGFVIPDDITSGNISANFEKYKSRIVGKEQHLNSGNFLFNNIEFISYNTGIFMYTDAVTAINNCDFFVDNGIYSDTYSGYLYLSNVKALGTNSGVFADAIYISDYNGIYSRYRTATNYTHFLTDINGSIFHHCDNGIQSIGSGSLISLKNSLMYDVGTGVYIGVDSSGGIHNSTIKATTGVCAFGTSFATSECVYDCTLNSISGVSATHEAEACVLTPDYNYIDSIATLSGCTPNTPYFSDPDHGDFNPLTGTTENADYCSSIDIGYWRIPDGVTSTAERYGFKFNDNSLEDYSRFLFQKNNNIIFSDYLREVALSKLLHNTNATQYEYNYTQGIVLNDIYTKSSFPIDPSGEKWPYDWDYENIVTPEIKNVNYIVPRSVIDITEALINVGINTSFDIENIKVKAYKNIDRRGVTFDYDNSKRGNMIIWTVDNDQMLYMRDIYTGEDIASYTLVPPVAPSGENLFIRPSGLIPHGKTANGYKFMLERDVATTIEGIDEYGNFEWLPTDKNTEYELYGITAYKNNLYITANYTTGNDTQPLLLMYPAKGYYKDYIDTNPSKFRLNPANQAPRDISVYEDGTILIGDGTPTASGVHMHKYNFRYDYALKDNYDKNYIRLYLREEYNDVTK